MGLKGAGRSPLACSAACNYAVRDDTGIQKPFTVVTRQIRRATAHAYRSRDTLSVEVVSSSKLCLLEETVFSIPSLFGNSNPSDKQPIGSVIISTAISLLVLITRQTPPIVHCYTGQVPNKSRHNGSDDGGSYSNATPVSCILVKTWAHAQPHTMTRVLVQLSLADRSTHQTVGRAQLPNQST